MNITAITAAVAGALALAIAAPAMADTFIDQRQANQEQRIDQGVRSGALTPAEAARLERGQARIERMESRALADGRMTPLERRRIMHAQDVQSHHIYRQKHDRQHR
ncbi:MAG: hypothetical protein A2X52_22330 [Candidatus Rokubacteria bacterium GWC2_70_16]|nr:MAG: hypothetical protein A2X52_22330 [Candidatus Rokubacteria bacterium GWC2_70_16]